ncbi:MAG: hypothetical protein R2769_16920 [Saprospiraceae bacterium]
MISIFKTSVEKTRDSRKIKNELNEKMPEARIVFDLEDCDRIFKIESAEVSIEVLEETFSRMGHELEILKK